MVKRFLYEQYQKFLMLCKVLGEGSIYGFKRGQDIGKKVVNKDDKLIDNNAS